MVKQLANAQSGLASLTIELAAAKGEVKSAKATEKRERPKTRAGILPIISIRPLAEETGMATSAMHLL